MSPSADLRAGYWYWNITGGHPVRVVDTQTGETCSLEGRKGWITTRHLRIVDAPSLDKREAMHRADGTWSETLAAQFATVRADNRLPPAFAGPRGYRPLTMGWFQQSSFIAATRDLEKRTRSVAVRTDCRVARGEEEPRELDSAEMACERVARELAMEGLALDGLVGEFFAALDAIGVHAWQMAVSKRASWTVPPDADQRLCHAEGDLREAVGLVRHSSAAEERIARAVAQLGAQSEPAPGWQARVIETVDREPARPSWWRRLFGRRS